MAVVNEISKAFNKNASQYESSAKVQGEIGQRLFERLDYLAIAPKRILDLGCGPGTFSRQLTLKYPKAQIIALDLAPAMLFEAKKKQGWRTKWSLVAADMQALPFVDNSFDLIFANQAIHWGNPLSGVFRELNRVMAVNACLMFSTLGPDTFKEIKTSWASINHYAHVNHFDDMHDIGDCLLKEYFVDPVMDMELLLAHYGSLRALVMALKNQGVKNINLARHPGLTGKTAWQQFETNYAAQVTEQGKYPLTYEVVYGHAWKGERRNTERGIETAIPISRILKS